MKYLVLWSSLTFRLRIVFHAEIFDFKSSRYIQAITIQSMKSEKAKLMKCSWNAATYKFHLKAASTKHIKAFLKKIFYLDRNINWMIYCNFPPITYLIFQIIFNYIFVSIFIITLAVIVIIKLTKQRLTFRTLAPINPSNNKNFSHLQLCRFPDADN